MSVFRLLLKNLLYHRRGNFAVFLGVVLGTAVLTGALLVGDSLRGSLRDLTLDQLGWVRYAMTPNRFFRANLLDPFHKSEQGITPLEHPEGWDRQSEAASLCSVMVLRGSAVKVQSAQGGKAPTVNRVTILGVDGCFWADVRPTPTLWTKGIEIGGMAVNVRPNVLEEVVINASLATALHAQKGDTIALRLQNADAIPRETLLGKRNDVVQNIEIKIAEVVADRGMGRFSLQPGPDPVLNAFLPLETLQDKLGVENSANVMLAKHLSFPIQQYLTLRDWGLKLRSPTARARALVRFLDPRSKDGNVKRIVGAGGWLGRVPEDLAAKADPETRVLAGKDIEDYYRKHRDYFLLESQQMLLEDAVVDAVKKAFGHTQGRITLDAQPWWLCPNFIYLADSIKLDKHEVSYAVVAAQGPLPDEKEPPLEKDQIDLADWLGSPFAAKPGDLVTVSYYAPDDHNHLQLLHADFKIRKVFPLTGKYDDPDLVPDFPGITDKLDMEDWNKDTVPFPYDPARGKLGEKYWKRYRTTPRAYISLETAQKLWGSRFGNLTSYRVMPLEQPKNYGESMAKFGHKLLTGLDPEKGGFVWRDVRAQGLKAGGGTMDFGVLFIAFSFFLIAAALLLVGLLFRLNLDLRAREIGVLLATGWTYPKVRRLLLGEGGLLAILGGFVGLLGALEYADLLLKYLSEQWPGEQKLQFLTLHVTPLSLIIGWSASVIVSFLAILWAVRGLARMTPTRLLAGETTASEAGQERHAERAHVVGTLRVPLQKATWHRMLIPSCLLLAAASMIAGFFVDDHEAKAGSFFSSGFFLLITAMTIVWRWLKRTASHSNPRQSLAGLAIRNAGRHAVRSVLTVGLLGSAMFLIVAVESFHKEAGHDFYDKSGGSGGFPYFAQSDVPIFQDLNAPAVRQDLPALVNAGPLPLTAQFFPCRLRAGDDASCLNLYQPLKPRILGVTRAMIERGGFSFAGTRAETQSEKANPWLLLEKPATDGTIPIFVDATTAEWTLQKKGLGDIIEIQDDRGEPAKLCIVGLFRESIFQSELVMAEASFRRLFPRQEGFGFFLIEAPADPEGKIRSTWETALADYGFSIQTTASRLERFLQVENTYLATFQALGGLGLLLGAVGLAIVLLRSVWERRGELALLRALGFSKPSLAWLVLAENLFLLMVGLFVGTLSAILSVAPQLVSGEASFLGLRVLGLVGLVLVVGLGAALAAVLATLRAPLLGALRQE